MSQKVQNSEITFFFNLVINANTMGKTTWGSPGYLETFHVEMDGHWETAPYVTISFLVQDLVHKVAKTSVLWMSQSGAPQAEALGIREEFVACKWRRNILL